MYRIRLVGAIAIALLGYLFPVRTGAQMVFGDTVGLTRETKDRAWFYVDTTTMKKWYADKDWVVALPHSAQYRSWWFQMARCQHMITSEVAFQHHHWFMVNTEIFNNKGPYQVGYSGYSLPNSTYLAGPRVHDREVVNHEIVHALMEDAGEVDEHHSSPRFDRCQLGGYDS